MKALPGSLTLLGLAFKLALATPVDAQDSRELIRLGLYGAEFTSSTGQQSSGLDFAADGYAAGSSSRYSGTTDLGTAAWVANVSTGETTRVGLTNADYTQSGGGTPGYQSSAVYLLSGGYAGGYSYKFSGAVDRGRAVWVADAATGATSRVGLTDSDYTQTALGDQYSTLTFLSDGYAAGSSRKYNGTVVLGQAVWVADAATGLTTRVGLFDSDYSQTGGSTPGYQNSAVSFLANGYAAGYSSKYIGTAARGQAAWLTNLSTGITTRIGFFDSDYTLYNNSLFGYQYSEVNGLADGYVAGVSFRYEGAQASQGRAAWIANTATGVTMRVGLYDSDYTFSTGLQDSAVGGIADGYVTGISKKYSGTLMLGQAAWVANAATGVSTRIGFFDSEYTQIGGVTNNGYQSSTVSHLANGYVGGSSSRYNGLASLGQAAWVSNAATGATMRVGLFDSAYTQANGTQVSSVSLLTEGYAAGGSNKYSGSTLLGTAAWIANISTGVTTRVGLTDNQHTQSVGSKSGYQFSGVSRLVGSFLSGVSYRYNGSEQVGKTPWVFNLETSTLDAIILSVRASDGHAFSFISALSDTGLAVGQYELFDSSGTYLGYRAFAWTPEDGAFDLASAVEGGISAASFNLLSSAKFPTGNLFGGETILGVGLIGANQAIYAAIPATPEPGTASLLALGGLGVLARRRR